MDVKQYYRKMREIQTTLPGPDVFVVSLETADGGKAGVVSEVSREIAAKSIVEGRAVLASDEERRGFLDKQIADRKIAQKAELARRLQVAIIADPNLEVPVAGQSITEPGSRK